MKKYESVKEWIFSNSYVFDAVAVASIPMVVAGIISFEASLAICLIFSRIRLLIEQLKLSRMISLAYSLVKPRSRRKGGKR